MVQAWYQGGLSVFDFTDSPNPSTSLLRPGAISPSSLVTGGFGSTYWWNGNAFGNEIARGFESFALQRVTLSPTRSPRPPKVRLDQFNAQLQVDVTADPASRWWAPGWTVRAGLDAETTSRLQGHVDEAQQVLAGPQKRAGIAQLDAAAEPLQDRPDQVALAQAFSDLADSLQ